MRKLFGTLLAAGIALAPAMPAHAEDQDLARFQDAVEGFVARIGAATDGAVRWEGSDPLQIRRDGDTLVCVIDHARLLLGGPQSGRLTLDHVEFRQVGQSDGGKLTELAMLLPKAAVLEAADGTETTLALKEGSATAVVDAQTGRAEQTSFGFSGARIEQPKSGTWISLGPLTMSYKFAAEPAGGWNAPVAFELKDIQFLFPQGPIGGAVDRIAYSGRAAGPSREQIEKLRNAVDALQGKDERQQRAGLLGLLPSLPGAFSTIRLDLAVDGVNLRAPTGEPVVSLAKAGIDAAVTGLDGDAAEIRIGVHHDGLDLAPALLDKDKQPHRFVVDLGLGDLSTEALRRLVEALGELAPEPGAPADEQQKDQATQQLLGAAAMLNPTFHVYNLALDTDDVGIDLTGDIKGSPLSPKGYSARADLLLRGPDAIPQLAAGLPFAEYVPVLKEIGQQEKTPDGAPRLRLHLASTPRQRVTIDGNDVDAWFADETPRPGQPRLLKPADPPLRGEDVASVQRALAAAAIPVPENGVYDAQTAAAVARFQKREKINISGVVDPPTRQKLGVPAAPARQSPPASGRRN